MYQAKHFSVACDVGINTVGRRRSRRASKSGRSEDVQYWNLPYSTVQSDAFRKLGGPSLKVLCEMRARFNGFNNGKISLSMDEAARLLGLSKGTVQRALKQLQEFGFIKLAKLGHWYGRQASLWTLTMCPIEGNQASNEWRQWRAPKTQKESKKINPRYPNGIPECFDETA